MHAILSTCCCFCCFRFVLSPVDGVHPFTRGRGVSRLFFFFFPARVKRHGALIVAHGGPRALVELPPPMKGTWRRRVCLF